jgi:hypothetical protein
MMQAGIAILHDVIGLFIPRTPCMAAVFLEYPFVDEVACAIKCHKSSCVDEDEVHTIVFWRQFEPPTTVDY